MSAIKFLTVDEVLRLQRHLVTTYGGETGVRDRRLLESAVAMPQAMFGGVYLHGDIFEMAAAYLFHITKNHPFVDGNKRAGAAAGFAFLSRNEYVLTATPSLFFETVLGVAEGHVDKKQAADFFRKHT